MYIYIRIYIYVYIYTRIYIYIRVYMQYTVTPPRIYGIRAGGSFERPPAVGGASELAEGGGRAPAEGGMATPDCATHPDCVTMFFSALAVPWFFVARKAGITDRKEIHPGMFFEVPEAKT